MKKKSVSTMVIDSILIALLVPSVLWCLVTSFGLNADITSAVICSVTATVVSVVVCFCVKNTKSAAAVCASAFAALILFLFLELQALISQLEYVLNRVLFRYSEYLPVPQSISIASENSAEATLLFSFIECILIFIFIFSIIRLKTSVPILIVSIIFLAPCFILLGTFPDILPLFLAVAAMAVLLITSGLRRHGVAHCGIISAVTFVLILSILGAAYIVVPPESFEREPWRDDFLRSLRQAVGLEPSGDSPQVGVGGSTADEVDLNLAGPLAQTHDLVMQVYTDDEQTLYLRGMAYANYENNTWSTLDSQQSDSYPEMSDTDNWTPLYSSLYEGSADSMRIVTRNPQEVLYTPYFLSENPGGEVNMDISILNPGRSTDYTASYNAEPWQLAGGFDNYYDSLNYEYYSDFLYWNYTDISAGLYDELMDAIEQSGLTPPSYGDELIYYDDYYNGGEIQYHSDGNAEWYSSSENTYSQRVVEFVRQLVSSSAEYSLDTPRVPEGEDIASYLLTDMDTGYCVHFATSAAMLLRVFGIPSRYVTGYCVNVSADQPYTTITSDNAHAWVEYFVDGVGWVPLEATPASFTPAVAYSDPIQEQPQTQEETQEETQGETQGETQSEAQTQADSEAQTDTQLPVSQATENANGDLLVSEGGLGVVLTIAAAVLALALAVWLRFVLTKELRRRRFLSGDKNRRAKYIYRYIERCAKYSKQSIPEDIYDIGAKASFSRRGVTKQELNTLLDYAKKSRIELYQNSSALKRLYYKLVMVI